MGYLYPADQILQLPKIVYIYYWKLRTCPNTTKVNNNKFYLLEEKYHGENYLNKISKVCKFLKLKNIDYLLSTSVENISWLLNISGSDATSSPLTNGKILFK